MDDAKASRIADPADVKISDVRLVDPEAGARPSPLVTIPLARAALCLECSHVFALGVDAAPCCGAREWFLLERFFEADGERTLVNHGDVLHEAGNGLTPARVRAERLVEVLEQYVDSGIARHPEFQRLAIVHGRRVVEAIDETLRRLRALGGARRERTT